MSKLPAVTLRKGETVHGFEIISVTPVEELRAVAYEAKHKESGARFLHLHADDPENLFSINFPTPPRNDTGLPHILEHSVLAGSKKFPVREPFFEMLKMSMATFINAMTGYDCTYYPVASNVKKDLFNLADVYFDAVFNPLLTEDTFLREGHHLEPAVADRPMGKLTVKGIVYNEMKGAFSSPESMIWRRITRGLFPDTVYGNESGGDPDAIPDLMYGDLTHFCHVYYQPGNAYFYLYGDIPTREFLVFIGSRLEGLDSLDTDPVVERQPRWKKPKALSTTYPIGHDEKLEGKTYLAMNWLAGNALDVQENLLFQVLTQILAGNEAAPLRKAIIDSKLGQQIIYIGNVTVGCELTFMAGIKGSEKDRRDALTKLVTGTLTKLADGQIGRELVESAFQQVAYRTLEIYSMFPLHTMMRAVNAWIYGADPLTSLRMGATLDACRKLYEKDPLIFNRLIRERLLDNPHRLDFSLVPSHGWQKNHDLAFARRMKKVRDRLSREEARAVADRAIELQKKNSEPNPPEALAKLPQLKISDLPQKPRHIPTALENLPGRSELLVNDVFANGVNYLEISFDLDGLPEDLWLYLPRYQDAIRKLGAAGMTFEKIAARLASCTGGLGCYPVLTGRVDRPGLILPRLHFSLTTLDSRIDPALDVLQDLFFAVDPRDPPRLKDAVIQARSGYRTGLVNNGGWTAHLHAGRALGLRGYLAELLDGLPQLRAIEPMHRDFDARVDELVDKILAIRDFVSSRAGFTASFTGSDKIRDTVRKRLASWADRMKTPIRPGLPSYTPPAAPPREGLAAAIQVAHCIRVMPAPHFSHPDEPLLALGAHLVSHDYMLNEIRLKGTAYGAGFGYDPLRECMNMTSFNDPHVTRTLQVYDKVLDYVRSAQWSQVDIDRAIISVAKQDEKPIRPANANSTALMRRLNALTPELRERRYARLKESTPAEVKRALLSALETNLDRSAICVTASREKLESANKEMKDSPLAIEDILVD